MNAKHKPRVQPLQSAQAALLSGEIIQLASVNTDSGNLAIIDQWQTTHQIDAQCQLLPQLKPGDRVVFCILDDAQVAVLHRLMPVQDEQSAQPAKQDKIEFSLPGVEDLGVTMSKNGIELRAGETSLHLNRDGSLSINARELKQTASENLRLKGGNVHIN